MTTQQQLTFAGERVDIAPHRSDNIWCDDIGEYRERQHAYASVDLYDDSVAYWSTQDYADDMTVEHEEERLESWGERFSEFFKLTEEWIDDYVRSDDYHGEYRYIMNEDRGFGQTQDWLTNRHKEFRTSETGNKYYSPSKAGEKLAELTSDIWDQIYSNDEFDSDVCGEYSSTSDNYFDSFDIGEYEEQHELSRLVEWFDDKGYEYDSEEQLIDDLLNWNEDQNEFCLTIDRNDFYETPHYNATSWRRRFFPMLGYRPIRFAERKRQYPTFYQHINTGLRVDWDLSDEAFLCAIAEVCVAYCERIDR